MSQRCQSPRHNRLHPGPRASHAEPGIHAIVSGSLPGREAHVCQDCCSAEIAGLLQELPREKQAEWFDRFQNR